MIDAFAIHFYCGGVAEGKLSPVSNVIHYITVPKDVMPEHFEKACRYEAAKESAVIPNTHLNIRMLLMIRRHKTFDLNYGVPLYWKKSSHVMHRWKFANVREILDVPGGGLTQTILKSISKGPLYRGTIDVDEDQMMSLLEAERYEGRLSNLAETMLFGKPSGDKRYKEG